MVASYVAAMEDSSHLSCFIKNPFDKKQEENVQLTLDIPVADKNDNYFIENTEGQNNQKSMSWYQHRPKKKTKKRSVQKKGRLVRSADVFKKNKDGDFVCPYNCPDKHTYKSGSGLVRHIKRRHDQKFDLQTFNPDETDLDAWIPRKIEKTYFNVFEKNEDRQYECPYNCPDEYAHKQGKMVVQHIKRKHDKDFNLQTFDSTKADLDVWIRGEKWHVDVFEKNDSGEWICPYNCPDNYVHKEGRYIFHHIKSRHDKGFDLQIFDRATANLNAWIPRKIKGGKKRYTDVFEKNEEGRFLCPYNCPDGYAYKQGKCVVHHIKSRHDKDFDLQTFDEETANLEAWIPRKRAKKRNLSTCPPKPRRRGIRGKKPLLRMSGKKRKRFFRDATSNRQKKKRKTRI